MKVQITGASNFVNRMFEAAGPYQWARELLKNAEEAGATRVDFGIEWQAVAALGVYRRTVVDDGRGMSPDELMAFFSTLGMSGKRVGGVHENYGVGAKIATLPWNPKGVVVVSTKKGKRSMIWMVLGKNGDYELVEFEQPGGRRVVVEPAVVDGVDWSKVVPAWAAEHGTAVVLLGDSAYPDTAAGHPRAGGTDLRGVARYLNSRFWDLAKIDVRVEELRNAARAKWPKSAADTDDATRVNRRRVRGARHYAETGAQSGVVEVASGKVRIHWYLAGDKPAVHTYAQETGYTAVRYAGELYQLSALKAHYRWFGVAEAAVQQRLTLVVEPDQLKEGWGAYPDQSRNRLMFASGNDRGVELPLATWAYEFAENIPEPIREAIRQARGSTSQAGEIDEETRKRLQDRFGARWAQQTIVATGGDQLGRAGRMAGPGARSGAGLLTGDSEGSETATVKPVQPQSPELEGAGRKHGHPTKTGVDIPKYRFASPSDFERPWHVAAWAPHDAGGPTVLVNPESPVVTDMVKYRQSLYPEVYAEEVASEVLRAVGEVAACRVAHSQHLSGMISEEEIDRDYRSERALTVSLMGLIDVEALIASRLRGKFRARA